MKKTTSRDLPAWNIDARYVYRNVQAGLQVLASRHAQHSAPHGAGVSPQFGHTAVGTAKFKRKQKETDKEEGFEDQWEVSLVMQDPDNQLGLVNRARVAVANNGYLTN